MRFEKKIEIVNIFRIQVKRSTFVKFQLDIDEKHLNVDFFWELEGKTAIRKKQIKMHSRGGSDQEY